MDEQGAGYGSTFTNRNVGIVLTVVFAAAVLYYWQQDWVFERLRDKFLLGLLTLVSLFWMTGCSILMIVDRQRDQAVEGLTRVFSRFFAVALVVPFFAYGFFAGSLWAGFPIGIMAIGTLATYALGLRPWTSALGSGVGIAVVVYTLFWVIGEPLPLGIFDSLFSGA